MLSHADIVARAGADGDVASKLGVNSHQVRDWRRRNRIPPEHWSEFARLRLATLTELAKAASQRLDGAA